MVSKATKNKVKELREGNAWSIAELARRANVVPQTVSKMEKDIATSRNSQLKVAKAFGKKHEELFQEIPGVRLISPVKGR
jgi:DNA-binding XRE family transcriptional regulator